MNGALANTETRTWYDWYDGAVQSRIEFRPDTGTSTRFNTYFSYDGSGHLLSAQVNDGRPRTVSYTNDLLGQVIRRDESDRNYSSGDPHEIWYRFGGRQMGYTGNNGTLDTDYKTSIDNRMRTAGSTSGAFRFGATHGSAHADFDLSLDPFTSYDQGGAGGSHTVRAGESLQSIAQNLWGDANLWYKIAEANGMAGSALSEGQRLTIPAGVMKNSHNVGTLKPYDPSDILGDVNPTTPQPQKASKKGNKCGVFGAVLLVVVAVAVTALTQGATTGFFTGLFSGTAAAGSAAATAGAVAGGIVGGAVAGAAGSIASQAVGLATGIRDKFSWKGVALAGISGGVGGGLGAVLPGAGFVGGALRGAAGSVVSQGIGVATGLQKKFDWAGVAAAGVIGGVSHAAGRALGAKPLFGQGADTTVGNHLRHAAASGASAIAGAATRSVLTGTSFGDNVMAVLPDVIGSTIGNMIANGVVGSGKMSDIEKEFVAQAEASAKRADTLPGSLTAPLLEYDLSWSDSDSRVTIGGVAVDDQFQFALTNESLGYSLNQQIGGKNPFGIFNLDVAPPALVELRQRYPEIVKWENRIWNQSLPDTSLSLNTEFPFVHLITRPGREYGFVAYQNSKDGSLFIEPLFPGLNPATGRSDMINLPKRVAETGQFIKPGYTTLLIEHTHPFPYSFGNQIGSGYARGPSGPDFRLSYRNPTAISVVQALAPGGGRQFFYFGPKLYPDQGR